MDKKLSENIYFSLIVVDFDYISVRHLMAGSFFPTAGALSNVFIDRYIKTFFWSIERDDLVNKIKNWGGNESHNALRMMELYEKEFNKSLKLNDQEKNILENIYRCYCFRYIDVMFTKKVRGMCEIHTNYMHTIDKICAFFRNKIEIIPPHQGNTVIDILIENNPTKIAAFNSGNVNLREVLLADNPYFGNIK